jgi:hypothetical protein
VIGRYELEWLALFFFGFMSVIIGCERCAIVRWMMLVAGRNSEFLGFSHLAPGLDDLLNLVKVEVMFIGSA